MEKSNRCKRQFYLLFKFIGKIRIFIVVSFILFSSFSCGIAAQKHTYEAEGVELKKSQIN